jgi:hypothetical protein
VREAFTAIARVAFDKAVAELNGIKQQAIFGSTFS